MRQDLRWSRRAQFREASESQRWAPIDPVAGTVCSLDVVQDCPVAGAPAARVGAAMSVDPEVTPSIVYVMRAAAPGSGLARHMWLVWTTFPAWHSPLTEGGAYRP
jgi:hypothetical protein